VNWNGTPELQGFYKTLLQLRKQNPALQTGEAAKPQILPTNADDRVLAFSRLNEGKVLLVILNLSAQEVSLQFPEAGGLNEGKYTNVFTNQPVTVNAAFSPQLKPWEYLVLTR
jgi:glycosidase